jgi:hypothetical protein
MAISGVIQKTFENREEGFKELEGAIPELVTSYTRKTEPDAWATWKGDPVLLLENPIEVDVYVKESKKKGVIRPAHWSKHVCTGAPLFTVTTKMGAGSFGLTAGPKSVGGTCICSALPDAFTAYQSIPGVKADRPGGRIDEQICRKCYSNKGQYMHRGSQYAQVLRYNWIKWMLTNQGVKKTTDAMISAVDAHAGNEKKREDVMEDPRFFRIHDSGDIFSADYWEVWKGVCEALDDICFWMPTRSWWAPTFAKRFAGSVPDNLTLRPSAYHFDDRSPVVPGLSAGSTAHFWERDRKTDPVAKGLADWPCPAYAGGKSGGKCMGAIERAREEWRGAHQNWLDALEDIVDAMDDEDRELTDGGKDCRVCWLNKDVSVSYKAH